MIKLTFRQKKIRCCLEFTKSCAFNSKLNGSNVEKQALITESSEQINSQQLRLFRRIQFLVKLYAVKELSCSLLSSLPIFSFAAYSFSAMGPSDLDRLGPFNLGPL